VVHAVLDRHAPGVAIFDVTHDVAAHDVRAGALALWRAAPWLVPGVILAVVDPGVGTSRRPVALEVEECGAVLVGPDNGLLVPAALRLGSISGAVELFPPGRRSPGPAGFEGHPLGATFDARDLFAPAAARAADGTAMVDLGRPIDPSTLAGDPVPAARSTPTGREAEVLWVDRFGNAQLNATPADTGPGPVLVRAGGRAPVRMRIVPSYGAIAPDGLALVIDSYGFLAVCADRRAAAEELHLRPGDAVALDRPPGTT
jgi:hypothetical protein